MHERGFTDSHSPGVVVPVGAPRLRTAVVARRRLLDAMDRAIEREMTFVTGPSGSGRSLLVTSWLACRDVRAAWPSLTGSVNALVDFWLRVGQASNGIVVGVADDLVPA